MLIKIGLLKETEIHTLKLTYNKQLEPSAVLFSVYARIKLKNLRVFSHVSVTA